MRKFEHPQELADARNGEMSPKTVAGRTDSLAEPRTEVKRARTEKSRARYARAGRDALLRVRSPHFGNTSTGSLRDPHRRAASCVENHTSIWRPVTAPPVSSTTPSP